MIVRQVDIWHLKLPFHYPFKHTLATHASSENLVVKITTENGSAGYGEGVPRVFVTGESLTGSISFLSETLGPAVFGASFSAPGNLVQESLAIWRSAGADRFPAALCALEMALWDAAGLTWGIPLSDFLGGKVRENVSYSAVLPLASEKQLLRLLELIKAMRMRFVKLKVGEANDLKVLEMIRKELGGEIDVRVDANGAWTAEEAVARLRDMLPYRISAVEQPVAKEDFAGLQRVSESLEIPVIADESLCTEEDARKLIEMRACRIFNIRLSKCGGLSAAAKIRDMAAAAGLACQLGCHVGETSILAAAGRHFACCSDHLTYVEGSFAPYLLAQDLVREPVLFHDEGIGPCLPGPGLGTAVREEALTELAVSHVSLS